MDGRNKTLNQEDMMAEAIAFQKEVNRATNRRDHGGNSRGMSGTYGSGDRTAAGTSRAVSRQPAAQKLATPEQLFGRPSHLAPAVPRNPPAPATQQRDPRPVDHFDPMQVDPHPGVPSDSKATVESTGRGIVSSRWATSASPRNEPSPVSNPGAPAKDTGRKSFHSSFPSTTLDTPKVPNTSKGLLNSRWSSLASPTSPSLPTPEYPDPSTLEPVYRSEDWLSDLSAEYKALSVETKIASETQPTQISPAVQPAAAQTTAQTAKPPTSESQHPGQKNVNASAASQVNTAAQPAGRAVRLSQAPNTNASPSVEPSRMPTSAQAASDQGGIFNDSAFKDWYNSQFMRRKA